jgi:hypothetical protein
MSVALAIASLSFSVRLPRLLPAPLRHPVVYALPTLMVLATMGYWMWRVRSKRPPRAIVVTAPQTGLAEDGHYSVRSEKRERPLEPKTASSLAAPFTASSSQKPSLSSAEGP